MRISTLSINLLLPLIVYADFTLFTALCDTGVPNGQFETFSVSKQSQGACGGCSLTGAPGDDNFEGGNPCAANCGAEKIVYLRNNQYYNMYVNGRQIGSCYPLGGGEDYAACNAWNYACLKYPKYGCVTTHCN